MRRTVVLIFSGGAIAAVLSASLLADIRPATAKSTRQCVNAGTACMTKCGLGTLPWEMIATCVDPCEKAEWKCLQNASDGPNTWGPKRGKGKDHGDRNKVPPKGGKKGQGIVEDPFRLPNLPGGNPGFGGPLDKEPPAKGPMSTGTWTPPTKSGSSGSTVKDPTRTPSPPAPPPPMAPPPPPPVK
jgi:hypothetical protein